MKLKLNLAQLIIAGFFSSLLIIASCSKEKSQSAANTQQEVEASQSSSEADAEAEVVFNGVFDDAMGVNNDVGISGTGIFFGRSSSGGSQEVARGDSLTPVGRCFTVTVTHTSANLFPVRVLIDFGTAGCPGPDGHIRRGKVIIEYSNRLIYPGAVATTSFDGFYIDSVKVEGTHKITNTSTTNNRQFKVDVVDAKLSRPNGNYTEWTSHKTITQVEGLGTPDMPRDDVFTITGNANGRVKKGSLLVAWESATTEPLYKRFTCQWIVKGRIRTIRVNNTASSPWVAILDFGGPNCDNQAVITINGTAHNITLP